MAKARLPAIDVAAVRRGDPDAQAIAVAACAARWFGLAGHCFAFPSGATEVVLEGDTSKAGLLAAAIDLRTLLTQSPQGRKALRDFGFEPLLEHVEGE